MLKNPTEKFFVCTIGLIILWGLFTTIGFKIGYRVGRAEGRVIEMLKFQIHVLKHMEIEENIFKPAIETEAPEFNDDVP